MPLHNEERQALIRQGADQNRQETARMVRDRQMENAAVGMSEEAYGKGKMDGTGEGMQLGREEGYVQGRAEGEAGLGNYGDPQVMQAKEEAMQVMDQLDAMLKAGDPQVGDVAQRLQAAAAQGDPVATEVVAMMNAGAQAQGQEQVVGQPVQQGPAGL